MLRTFALSHFRTFALSHIHWCSFASSSWKTSPFSDFTLRSISLPEPFAERAQFGSKYSSVRVFQWEISRMDLQLLILLGKDEQSFDWRWRNDWGRQYIERPFLGKRPLSNCSRFAALQKRNIQLIVNGQKVPRLCNDDVATLNIRAVVSETIPSVTALLPQGVRPPRSLGASMMRCRAFYSVRKQGELQSVFKIHNCDQVSFSFLPFFGLNIIGFNIIGFNIRLYLGISSSPSEKVYIRKCQQHK